MEPTLTLTRDKYKAQLGVFAGVGRGSAFEEPAWDDITESSIEETVASGLRQFYAPPILPGERYAYVLSLLKPIATLTLADGESTVYMPDDFGGFEGPITIVNTAGAAHILPQEKIVNEGAIRAQYSVMPDRTGSPLVAAIQLRNGDDTPTLFHGTRSQLYVFPIADQDYTIQFPYYLLPNALDGTHPYAYGSQLHNETILASIKAAWERDMDDIMFGPQWQNFMQRLATSISLDRLQKPQFLGRNRDRSDCDGSRFFARHGLPWGGITYMGNSL